MTRFIGANGASEPRTLNEAAYRALRAAILSCELKPGERLLFDTLKARYEVGTSPLREAMTRLASEGLVVFESHKGARGPLRDAVLLGSAGALIVAGRTGSLREGAAMAAQSIDSGAAARALDRLAQITNEAVAA